MPPYQGGGGMINEVKKEDITFADAYTKFEAGTMQTAEVVAFAESLNFIEDLGIKNIASHENEILQYGLEKLRKKQFCKYNWRSKRKRVSFMFYFKGHSPS